MEQRQRSMGRTGGERRARRRGRRASCRVRVAVVAMRIDPRRSEPEGGNWWLVAWLIAGTAYGTTATVLLLRPGRRLIGFCFAVVRRGVRGHRSGHRVRRRRRPAARSPTAPSRWRAGVLAALVPLALLPVTAWRRLRNGWWATVVAVGVGPSSVTVADVTAAAGWVVATSRAASTAGLGVVWWSRRQPPTAIRSRAGCSPVPSRPGSPSSRASSTSTGWLSRPRRRAPPAAGGDRAAARRWRGDRRPARHPVTDPWCAAGKVVEWTILAGGIVVVYTGRRRRPRSHARWQRTDVAARRRRPGPSPSPSSPPATTSAGSSTGSSTARRRSPARRAAHRRPARRRPRRRPAAGARRQPAARAAPRRRGHRPAASPADGNVRRRPAADDPPPPARPAPSGRGRRPARHRLGRRPVPCASGTGRSSTS